MIRGRGKLFRVWLPEHEQATCLTTWTPKSAMWHAEDYLGGLQFNLLLNSVALPKSCVLRQEGFVGGQQGQHLAMRRACSPKLACREKLLKTRLLSKLISKLWLAMHSTGWTRRRGGTMLASQIMLEDPCFSAERPKETLSDDEGDGKPDHRSPLQKEDAPAPLQRAGSDPASTGSGSQFQDSITLDLGEAGRDWADQQERNAELNREVSRLARLELASPNREELLKVLLCTPA